MAKTEYGSTWPRKNKAPIAKYLRRNHHNNAPAPVYAATVAIFITMTCLIWLALDESSSSPSNEDFLHRRAGNTGIASDLYGLGVRVGIYTQAAGMLSSAVCLKVGGIKIACSATMIALLSSWTTLARHKDFSASEAFLIISLVGVISVAGMPVSFIPDLEGGIGGIALLVANLWTLVISFWFWSTLYRQLPYLGTSNSVWMFARVSVNGWFRIFMLVSASLTAFFIVFSTLGAGFASYQAAKYGTQTVVSEEALKEAQEELKVVVWIWSAVGALVLILTIASVEMIIRYNRLQPENVLSPPGQSIPLAIGLTVFIDGITVVITTIISYSKIRRARRRGW